MDHTRGPIHAPTLIALTAAAIAALAPVVIVWLIVA